MLHKNDQKLCITSFKVHRKMWKKDHETKRLVTSPVPKPQNGNTSVPPTEN